MKAYQIEKGYYIGEVSCQESPLEPGVFLTPGGCIKTPPPTTSENQIPYWNGSSWEVKPDHSNTVYYSRLDGKEKRFERGEEPTSDYTIAKPIKDELHQKFVNNSWVVDEDAKLLAEKKNRIAELRQLLSGSDYRMTQDYFASMEQVDRILWTNSRNAWRSEVRQLLKEIEV